MGYDASYSKLKYENVSPNPSPYLYPYQGPNPNPKIPNTPNLYPASDGKIPKFTTSPLVTVGHLSANVVDADQLHSNSIYSSKLAITESRQLSDIRLKEEVMPFYGGPDVIRKLDARTYKWRDDALEIAMGNNPVPPRFNFPTYSLTNTPPYPHVLTRQHPPYPLTQQQQHPLYLLAPPKALLKRILLQMPTFSPKLEFRFQFISSSLLPSLASSHECSSTPHTPSTATHTLAGEQ
jgi:hypothetical protein